MPIHKSYMYILRCANGKFYTGSTVDLKRRLAEHKEGMGAKYTARYSPIKLVYFETFDRIDKAFDREHQVKKWSHKKKQALINENWDRISELSKKVFGAD